MKFAGAGATVTVHVEQSAGRTRVDVTDTGPPVDPDDLADCTRPFWRGPAHQNVAGSGLGLAIVATLLQRYDGTLTLAPATPQGVCVTLTLPATRAR